VGPTCVGWVNTGPIFMACLVAAERAGATVELVPTTAAGSIDLAALKLKLNLAVARANKTVPLVVRCLASLGFGRTHSAPTAPCRTPSVAASPLVASKAAPIVWFRQGAGPHHIK
jgi:hypothetical protein